MQYILTEKEYEALIKNNQDPNKVIVNKNELQRVCTLVAKTIPVKVSWLKEPTIWGCILSDDSDNDAPYCDYCPVVKLCPHTGKEFSK